MASNFNLQGLVHKLDEGGGATFVKLLSLACLGLGVLIVIVFDPMYWNFFRGLSHAKGMEQAQIAREIARGNGYSTKMVRPLAVEQIRKNLSGLPPAEANAELARRIGKDTYHAPLWSATLAPILKAAEGRWGFDSKRAIYDLDKIIAVFSVLLFYAAVGVNFFTFRQLFDTKLALIVSGVQLVTYPFWQYAMSGLPHMLLLLLFSTTIWAVVKALAAREEKKTDLKWIVLIGVLCGLMVLTHYIMAWVVLGLISFFAMLSTSRWRSLGIITLITCLMVTPWLVRNHQLTGSLSGIAGYSAMHGVSGTESNVMRRIGRDAFNLRFSGLRSKIQSGLTRQIANGPAQLGGWLAPLFFIALLFSFRRPSLRKLRWLLLLMWLSAVVGMTIFAAEDVGTTLSATNLHLLFIPFFAAYGIAFILTLWNGLNIRLKFLQNALITLIILIAGLPFINAILNKGLPFWWPPYAPPYVAFLTKWTGAEERIVSDMPWAVAWYADRHSLWLPTSPEVFVEINDFNQLGKSFGGMFLSPITSSAPFMAEIVRGQYKDWAPFIMRLPQRPSFPFTKGIPLGPKGECIFYSDFERWSPDEADKLKEMQEKSEAQQEADEKAATHKE